MGAVKSMAESVAAAQAARADTGKGYIVGPRYDWFFFIGSPLIALFFGLLVADTAIDRDSAIFNYDKTPLEFAIGVFIFAHLFIVIFRSHVNRQIFDLYPARFTLVPIILFVAMGMSTWVLVCCSVLATFWDVYHSSLQTFGLGRIYDSRAGNDHQAGRRLDYLLNLLLYAGPIAAGATLMDHVEDFEEFAQVGSVFLTSIPFHTQSKAQYLSWLVIVGGSVFLLYYLYAYAQLSRRGYQVSRQKVALLLSTAVCSIWAWGFNPFGMAFIIMNLFHALQYFAIVWWAEKGNMSRVFGLQDFAWAKPATLVVFVSVGLAYGVFAEQNDSDSPWILSLVLVVSLMHFWYDGFVWSVKRKQV